VDDDDDDARSGQLFVITYVEVMEEIYQRIRDHRRISSDETASEINICHGKTRWKNCLRPKQHFIVVEA
jgi:hypothetical protein